MGTRDELLASSEVERLFQAVCLTKTPEEAKAFLVDVCSPKEIIDLAQRLEVATMLRSGASYTEVSRVTGASSTTVSRVSKCLNGPAGGYRTVLSRLDGPLS
jgi:TrpR-related protein YerC/YecD